VDATIVTNAAAVAGMLLVSLETRETWIDRTELLVNKLKFPAGTELVVWGMLITTLCPMDGDAAILLLPPPLTTGEILVVCAVTHDRPIMTDSDVEGSFIVVMDVVRYTEISISLNR
jgi:hypothetical protein